MLNNIMEAELIKLIIYLPKVFASMIGAVFSLVLSGDIGKDGTIKITISVLLKFTIAVGVSLFGGEAFIEFYGWQDKSIMSQGAVMLAFAIFGMLLIGIVYQSLELMRGKKLSDIIKEIRDAFFSILGR